MNTIDIFALVTSIITAIIPLLSTTIIQKIINKKYGKFEDLKLEFVKSIHVNKNIEMHINNDEDMDNLMKSFKEAYSKMLEDTKSDCDEISIALRKYNQKNGYFITIYYLPSKNVDSHSMLKDSIKLKDDMVNLYINNINPKIDDVFESDSEIKNYKYGSYLSYALKKRGKIIGSLSVSSQEKVNERYSYENIKDLIEPIENTLISYIQSKKDNFLISDN